MKEFIEKGAMDYIKKPFTPEETQEKLYAVMGGVPDGKEITDTGDEDLDF